MAATCLVSAVHAPREVREAGQQLVSGSATTVGGVVTRHPLPEVAMGGRQIVPVGSPYWTEIGGRGPMREEDECREYILAVSR